MPCGAGVSLGAALQPRPSTCLPPWLDVPRGSAPGLRYAERGDRPTETVGAFVFIQGLATHWNPALLPGTHPQLFHSCLQTGAQEEEPEEEISPRTAAAAAAVGPSLAPEAPEPPLPGVWQLVREKRFAMPPITVDEAIVCLNYVDHNFYVRRLPRSGSAGVEGVGSGRDSSPPPSPPLKLHPHVM